MESVCSAPSFLLVVLEYECCFSSDDLTRSGLIRVRCEWKDTTAFAIYGMKAKKTRKQIYQEFFGKKATQHYARQYPSLTRKEIDQIVTTHVEHLKTATVVMHVAPLLEGDFTRANLEARRLKNSIPA